MFKRYQGVVVAAIGCWLGAGYAVAEPVAVHSFSTGGHTVYQLRTGKLTAGGDTVLMAAAYDGALICFSKEGTLLWKNDINKAIPYDLAVADIDGDGCDDTLLASADGSLYAFDHRGELRWIFSREAPLMQVCVVKRPDGDISILTGGFERILYSLSPLGEIVQQRTFEHAIRHIRCGDILGEGKSYAVVLTSRTTGSVSTLWLIEPVELKSVWDKEFVLQVQEQADNKKQSKNSYKPEWANNQVSVDSMLIHDFNNDGKQDIALGTERGIFQVYGGNKSLLMISSGQKTPTRPYSMNQFEKVAVGAESKERIINLIGNLLILYTPDAKVERFFAAPYALTCQTFDASSKTLYLGSSISGGDGIYALHLDKPGWEASFEGLKPEAKLAMIERNIDLLNRQIAAFKPPSYQPSPRKTTVITKNILDKVHTDGQAEIEETFFKDGAYRHVSFAPYYTRSEKYDRSKLDGIWKTKRDRRAKYNYSAKELVAFAAEREKKREPFALWAGHGSDPFYMQLSTMEKMLAAAPTMLKALVFAELEHTDEDMAYAVKAHLIPLAKLCQKQGTTKIVLRNKNVFWNATCYLPLWRDTLLTGEFKDVFVLSMEETNCRTQEISLSGRQGLWLAGLFDHISSRAVTDSAVFSRWWEWGSQQKQTHHVRTLAYQASLGADFFLVNIYQGDERDVAPFYRMVDKGIIAIPDRRSLLSVSEVCLGMQNPSTHFVEHGANGHEMSTYAPGEPEAVFSRMDCYWAGTPIPDTDFSHYAMGSRFRTLNFLARNPYGLIATVPAGLNIESSGLWKTMLHTDGEFFYEKGNPVSTKAYKPTAEALLEEAASRLPVRVIGDVAWTVVRLDPTHVRVTLIDPGYTDPADRDARIVLQHLNGVQCRDILSGERLPLEKGQISLQVPAAILRIVDIEHR